MAVPAASTIAEPPTETPRRPRPPWLAAPLPAASAEVEAAGLRCARGNAIDCMRAGDAYESGRGIPQDTRQARLNRSAGARLFETACRRREIDACYALSVLHTLGHGVLPNPRSAAGYLTRAREICKTSPAPICEQLPAGGAPGTE
ncbi:MAG: sel1 repeat family protein [Polyangiaceae bacterium]|nr:sel1 repeat family protein [Polyangiaceae bacterium]